METLQLSGFIRYDDNDGRKIILVGESDIDLVEEFEQFHRKQIQVNYWISDNQCTKNEMLEAWIRKISGAVHAEYDEVFQGSWTFDNSSCVGYDKNGKIVVGGHDLFDELESEEGRFIILEINYNL